MSQKFTFADAKKKIKELESQLKTANKKMATFAGDLILDTKDNVFTQKELKKIRFLEMWAIVGPIAGIIIGVIISLFV